VDGGPFVSANSLPVDQFPELFQQLRLVHWFPDHHSSGRQDALRSVMSRMIVP
jgi:hypothetical protein